MRDLRFQKLVPVRLDIASVEITVWPAVMPALRSQSLDRARVALARVEPLLPKELSQPRNRTCQSRSKIGQVPVVKLIRLVAV